MGWLPVGVGGAQAQADLVELVAVVVVGEGEGYLAPGETATAGWSWRPVVRSL
ncbi:hypothetical protein ACFQZ4_08680 [Catellatospora coxensis]